MKYVAAPLLAICLTVVGCAESNPTAPDAEIVAASNKVQAQVQGMSCTGCSYEICSAVQDLEGVTKAYADPATGKVIVALADDADTDAMMKQIETTITGLSDGKYTIQDIVTVRSGSGEPTQTQPAEPAAS